MSECALLDTGFLIRLIKQDDELHNTVVEYFKYFMTHEIRLYVSTIAVAEFCVKDNLGSLPIKNFMFVPFNVAHATRAGELMRIVYDERKSQGLHFSPRLIIPNDTKMFAQADVERNITYYVSADSEANKVFETIRKIRPLSFNFIDVRKHSYSQYFGEIDFPK